MILRGLLSDCTHELPDIWPSLPVSRYVDATVFSVIAGVRKPHPTLYATLLAALAVEAHECLYVGDGGSGELTGAHHAGMTALPLDVPDVAHSTVYDADTAWTGPSIGSLDEVIALVS